MTGSIKSFGMELGGGCRIGVEAAVDEESVVVGESVGWATVDTEVGRGLAEGSRAAAPEEVMPMDTTGREDVL